MTHKIIKLPLSPTDMVEFFKDKSVLHVIDVDNTADDMNERSMLLYLANLGIHCSFTRITNELMAEYIVLKETVDSPDLIGVHANILGYIKYQEILYPELESAFPVDRIIDFAEANAETLAEQLVFLDSFLLYAMSRQEDVSASELSSNTDDELHESISLALISLLNFEDFMIMYSRDIPRLSEQTYYTRYFDDYMFRGKNLFDYAHTCPYFGLLAVVRSHQDEASTSGQAV